MLDLYRPDLRLADLGKNVEGKRVQRNEQGEREMGNNLTLQAMFQEILRYNPMICLSSSPFRLFDSAITHSPIDCGRSIRI